MAKYYAKNATIYIKADGHIGVDWSDIVFPIATEGVNYVEGIYQNEDKVHVMAPADDIPHGEPYCEAL